MFEDKCILVQFTIRRSPDDPTGKHANARRRSVRKLLDEYGAEKIDESSYCISPGIVPAGSFGLKLRRLLERKDWYEVGIYKRVIGTSQAQKLLNIIS